MDILCISIDSRWNADMDILRYSMLLIFNPGDKSTFRGQGWACTLGIKAVFVVTVAP